MLHFGIRKTAIKMMNRRRVHTEPVKSTEVNSNDFSVSGKVIVWFGTTFLGTLGGIMSGAIEEPKENESFNMNKYSYDKKKATFFQRATLVIGHGMMGLGIGITSPVSFPLIFGWFVYREILELPKNKK